MAAENIATQTATLAAAEGYLSSGDALMQQAAERQEELAQLSARIAELVAEARGLINGRYAELADALESAATEAALKYGSAVGAIVSVAGDTENTLLSDARTRAASARSICMFDPSGETLEGCTTNIVGTQIDMQDTVDRLHSFGGANARQIARAATGIIAVRTESQAAQMAVGQYREQAGI